MHIWKSLACWAFVPQFVFSSSMVESIETKLQTWVYRTLLPTAAINGYTIRLPDGGRFVTTQTTKIISGRVSLKPLTVLMLTHTKEKESLVWIVIKNCFYPGQTCLMYVFVTTQTTKIISGRVSLKPLTVLMLTHTKEKESLVWIVIKNCFYPGQTCLMYVFVTTQTTKIISGRVSLKPLTVLMLTHTKEKESLVWIVIKNCFYPGQTCLMYVFVTTQTTKIISGRVSLKPLTVLMLTHTKEKESLVWIVIKNCFYPGQTCLMYVFVTTQTTKIISGRVSLKPLTVLMLAHTKEKEKRFSLNRD